jgi:hypothetical protein
MNLTEVSARVNPDGFVAQRFAQDFNGHGHWVLTYFDIQVGGLTVKVLDDEAVADWTELVSQVGDQS